MFLFCRCSCHLLLRVLVVSFVPGHFRQSTRSCFSSVPRFLTGASFWDIMFVVGDGCGVMCCVIAHVLLLLCFFLVYRLHRCCCGSITYDGYSLLVLAVAVFVVVIVVVGHWLWFLASLCLLQSVF